MWKLKIAEGGNPWLRTLNNHVGRQIWEFDPDLGSPEELAEIEKARQTFSSTRFQTKHSSDLLMRIQLSKENPCPPLLPQVNVRDTEDVTEEMVTNTLKRALNFYSTLQAHDGHWPGDYGGPMFLMPGLGSGIWVKLDSAYGEALCSGDELVLMELFDRTGPVLECLSSKTAGDILSILASYLREEKFTTSILPWLQQVVDLSTVHGPNCLVLTAKARQKLLSAIQEAVNMDFSSPLEKRSVSQIAVKLHHIWGK